MQFRERLFEGQLVVGQEGSLQRKAILVDWVPSITRSSPCGRLPYAVAEFLNLSDVCIVPTGDEVLIALAAYAVLAHNSTRESVGTDAIRRVPRVPTISVST